MPCSKLDDITAQHPAPPIPPEAQSYGGFRPKMIGRCAGLESALAMVYFKLGVAQSCFSSPLVAIQPWFSAFWLIVTAYFTFSSLEPTRRGRAFPIGTVIKAMIASIQSIVLAILCIAVSAGALFHKRQMTSKRNHDIDPNIVISSLIIAVSVVTMIVTMIPAIGGYGVLQRRQSSHIPQISGIPPDGVWGGGHPVWSTLSKADPGFPFREGATPKIPVFGPGSVVLTYVATAGPRAFGGPAHLSTTFSHNSCSYVTAIAIAVIYRTIWQFVYRRYRWKHKRYYVCDHASLYFS